MSFGPSSEHNCSLSRRCICYLSNKLHRLASLEVFCPYSVSPHEAAAFLVEFTSLHLTSAYRFSQPPGAFFRPVSAGLISFQIHSWGSALQGFPPSAQQFTVSSAFPSLALVSPQLHNVDANVAPPKRAPEAKTRL
jgi:hypothetical protein